VRVLLAVVRVGFIVVVGVLFFHDAAGADHLVLVAQLVVEALFFFLVLFQLLVAGETVTDIASKLNLSGKTVSTHKARLMEKLGIDNQADLVRYAMKHGLSDDV